MKLALAVSVVMLATSIGCAPPRAPRVSSMTTLTSAPLLPDEPVPAVVWEEDEPEPAPPVLETWGVRPPTQQELDEYGF